MNINEFKVIVDKGMYSCNHKKNNICPKTCCYYKGWKYGCTNTSHWEYAKRTPWNYLIRALHKFKRRRK